MSRPPGRKTLGDWIGAHTRALAAIDGVPRLIVPDNAKVAVIKACLYQPQVNRSYAEMAAHYGTAILPTRPHGRGRGSHHRTMDLGHGCDIGASTASPN